MITKGRIVAKCHSTAGEKLKSAILDKLEGTKQTCPDKKFKVMVKGHSSFVSGFCFLKTIKAIIRVIFDY